MKKKLKNLMMLMLLVMIVSPTISQNVYIIDNNRYTCYNNYENREIAKLLLSEEYAKLEINNLTFQNRYLENNNIELKDRVYKQDNTIVQLNSIIDKVQTTNKGNLVYIKGLKDKNKNYKHYIIGSVIINVILILILL